jgi:hypothetical protein
MTIKQLKVIFNNEEKVTSRASKEQTLEDLMLEEIKKLQAQIKPGIFRVSKNKRK